jgi:hypothetical protein
MEPEAEILNDDGRPREIKLHQHTAGAAVARASQVRFVRYRLRTP